MKNKLTDEQIDMVLTRLMADTVVDESVIEEISTSPTTWWAVKRNIAQNSPAASPWPPTSLWRRFFPFAVPALAALVVAVGMVWISSDRTALKNEITDARPTFAEKKDENLSGPTVSNDQVRSENSVSTTGEAPINKRVVKQPQRSAGYAKAKRTIESKAGETEKVSTEFIALSHAGGPESGQVIRVKVPSSMMVSLGVVPNVDKPSSLIDAEVVVGDDGQTHAIRFIR